ncbi:MBL fold metallo-hydrolase [Spongiactinospora sp. TRM90649]|uniref:MBL fold metallo-hydrolase n=1 Tax=Spongiactinospora sp. TRM90649 TaxID=3031114 RepID=UPI0023F98D89|nr:MBL fold metallo-hydrolase [Spongiactinospora sp. TRM90649]MDF5757745.1 MBL fold metallo-hydrolase [Spongiactinospora sp. TRM90649]
MSEIAPGVWDIDLGRVHAYLVRDDDGLILIDSGLPGRADTIERAVSGTGHRPDDLHTVLVTHRHGDHIGSLAEVRRRTGARIVAGALDAPVVDGSMPEPKGSLPARLLGRLMPAVEPVPVDALIDTGDETPVAGLTPLHTPGHTLGHISFLLDRAGGVLFVGDAAVSRRKGIARPPRYLNDDIAATERSLRGLAELDFEFACFGHGRVIKGGATDRFREYAVRS